MKFLLKILGIAILIISFSCKEEQSEESKSFDVQMKETIQIHDDVMPKMSEINSMISRLEAKKETLLEAEEDKEAELYDTAISDLKEAHDLMMSWMKNFSNTFSRTEINSGLATKDQDSIKAKLQHLDVQYKSAQEMKAAINEAIENAQALLGE